MASSSYSICSAAWATGPCRFKRTMVVKCCGRLPACAALLTTPEAPNHHHLVVAELPALYAIFREQLIDWLQQA